MKGKTRIKYLFADIGGVLLTDGWVHEFRKLAAKKFDLDPEEMEKRHNQAFDTYELGKLNIEEYLNRVVFYEKRSFTPTQFKNLCSTSRSHIPK
jgi:putative hydrolase of the HAD superfamily